MERPQRALLFVSRPWPCVGRATAIAHTLGNQCAWGIATVQKAVLRRDGARTESAAHAVRTSELVACIKEMADEKASEFW